MYTILDNFTTVMYTHGFVFLAMLVLIKFFVPSNTNASSKISLSNQVLVRRSQNSTFCYQRRPFDYQLNNVY